MLTHLRALFGVDGMTDQKFDCEFEVLEADKRVGLERADLLFGKNCVEVVDARREHRLPHALLLKDKGGQSQRPGRRQPFLGVTMERGLAAAQRVLPVREVPSLVDRLAKGQDRATVKAMERPLSQAINRRHMPRNTVAGPTERYLEHSLTHWLCHASGAHGRHGRAI